MNTRGLRTQALSGRAFAGTLIQVINTQGSSVQNTRQLENLARKLDISDTMSFVTLNQEGLFVSFSKDNGRSELARFSIPNNLYKNIGNVDRLALYIDHLCVKERIYI